MDDLMDQLRWMLELNFRQKSQINEEVMSHRDWSPVLRHDLMHHVLVTERMPDRLDGESDFDYQTRLLQLRRRLDEQNRLAGCILMMIHGETGGR